MWLTIGLIGGFGLLLLAVIALAHKGGSKQAKLEAALVEARERNRASKIMASVRNLSADDVRNRLHKLSDK